MSEPSPPSPSHAAGPLVVVARDLPAAGLELLRERFRVETAGLRSERSALLRLVPGAAGLVADPTVPVDGELLEAAGPELRVVANFAVGYDNIDLAACREHGVVVTNTPDVLTNATAELAVAAMLAAARRLGEGERMVRAGRWTGWDPGQLLGRELCDATVGIVGLGRIGARVAELLRGFGARLLYTARGRKADAESRLGLEWRSLEDLLAEADVVTLHVPLSPETRHMIDREALARFRPGALLVNTARGGLVDTEALVEALESGPLGSAALDVYEREPEVPRALVELENVVLLPHLGSASGRARDGMARLAAENVVAVLGGGAPVTPVVA